MLLVKMLVLFVLFVASRDLFAQKWSEIKIVQDSLQPVALKFADSLTGYFYGVVPVPYDDGVTAPTTRGRHHWYRTLDGGRTWLPIDFDTLYNGRYFEDSTGKRWTHSFTRTFAANNLQHANKIACFGKMVIINPGQLFTNGRSVLLVSTDKGNSWKEQPSEPEGILRSLFLTNAFASNLWIGTASHFAANLPVRSLDGAKTFTHIEGNDMFLRSTTDTSDTGNISRLSINLGCSTPDRWTAVIVPHGDDDLNQKKPGLMTLVTEDGGSTWSFHQYFLPNDSSLWIRGVNGIIGYLKTFTGTSSLYFPTLQRYHRPAQVSAFSLFKHYSGERFNKSDNQITSYLYTSDNGSTWQPETTFHKRRVAFEAAAPGNVWMTLWRNELEGQGPAAPGMFADVIAHTTDFGKTWTEDSITLHPQEFTPLDGNIICFTDPNHGWIAASNQFGTSIFRYRGEPSSVDEHQTSELDYQLYPNPANEVVNVATSLNIQQLEVYDALGRTYRCHYELTDGNAVVDCSKLTPGNYFVRLTALRGGQTKATTKFFSILR